MNNRDIRLRLAGRGLTLWQLAEQLRISEPTMTRWLRSPLVGERREQIVRAIEAMEKREEVDDRE